MRKGRKNGKSNSNNGRKNGSTPVATTPPSGPLPDGVIGELRRIKGRRSIHLSVEEAEDARRRVSVEVNGDVSKMATDSPRRGGRRKRGRRRSSATSGDGDERIKAEQNSLVLWRRPDKTLYYFALEATALVADYAKRLIKNWKIFLPLLLAVTSLYGLTLVEGPHQKYLDSIKKEAVWCAYWVGLGILSSVGLGTGLHTFLLYLGPHIARVTLAAYECGTTAFPEPPYPSTIECPPSPDPAVNPAAATVASVSVTLWSIMSKVRVEAFMWGAGTAIGELPPYFMARAARLSGKAIEDEEYEELEELLQEKETCPSSLSLFDRAKLFVHSLINRVGFFGILACASIPNPLFDLAGITCGHFLVPFWTFFGATLIGKAIIKMHIQQVFVIFLFTKQTVEAAIDLISRVPKIGIKLQQPLAQFLESQKSKLHRTSASEPSSASPKESILGWLLEKLVLLMVAYFVISIVNSMAQSYYKRRQKAKREKI